MSPPPRSYPTPTIPPPDRIRNKLRPLLTDWKAILVYVVGIGWSAHTVWASVATRTDLSTERDWAAAEHAVIRLEVGSALKRLDTLDEGNRWRDATLKAIADKIGAYAPPPPVAP